MSRPNFAGPNPCGDACVRWWGVSLLALAAAATPLAASAQAPAATSLEEIVVTAQRRSENLQNVPIAVTAVTAAALTRAGVNSGESLALVVPGLNLGRAGGKTVQPFIRGVGTSGAATALESPVATYIDGVYIADLQSAAFQFNNIDRVEVLKGPQGTLFGRNATGGLINVITRDPSVTPELRGSITYGNYDTWEGNLYATAGAGPVAADIALYVLSQSKGFGENSTIGDRANWRQEIGARSKLVFKPTDDDQFTFAADFYSTKGDYGITSNAYPGSVIIGGYRLNGFYDRQGNYRASVPLSDHRGFSGHYKHSFSWGQFTSISAYRRDRTTYHIDQDAGPVRAADTEAPSDVRTLQQEFLLNGQVDRLTWTVGVFAFGDLAKYRGIHVRSASPTGNVNIFSQQDTSSYAGYVQATYALTPTTDLTGGFRYTADKRKFRGYISAGPTHPSGDGTVLLRGGDSAKSSDPTWRLSIGQKLADDVLLYASYNRGFRSGSFNITSLTAPVLEPETLDAYEVGLKSQFFDNSVRFNVAAFLYTYKNIQLARSVTGGTLLSNAAAARVKGVDGDITYAPRLETGRLQLSAGFSVLQARYTRFPNGPLSTNNPTGGDSFTSAILSGNHMIRAPDFTLSLSADYAVPVGDGELAFNVTGFHTSRVYWEPDERISQPGYELVNAFVAYGFGPEHRYRVKAFAKNVFDKKYLVNGAESSLGDNMVPGLPRLIGVGVDFEY